MSNHSPKPKIALLGEAGPRAGKAGKDNAVYQYELPPGTNMADLGDWVIKVSHELTPNLQATNRRSPDKVQATRLGALYKQHKYNILKHFLGEHIPDSMFVAGEAKQGSRMRHVEYTIQRRIPNVSLNMLSKEQQADPRLTANLLDLFKRMQYMYFVLGEASARSSHHVNLDAKLDMGGISSFVKGTDIDVPMTERTFTEDDAHKTIVSNTSTNVLVDPETMQVYAIDFDQGEWLPGMSEAEQLAYDLDARNQKLGIGPGNLASTPEV